MNRMFLVIIDAYSKWIKIIPMTAAISDAVANRLRPIFAQFGLPETLVSVNGPNFVSAELEEFLQKNGIRHVTSSHTMHPATNGLAGRAVQTFKQGMKKLTDGPLSDRIARFLFSYRMTPQSTTCVFPEELLQGRKLRSRLDLSKPDMASRVEKK